MGKDVFKITVELTVDRDMVPGFGYTAQSWLNLAFYEFLRQSHYHASIQEVKAECIRNGKSYANASTCALLDEIIEVKKEEWLEHMRTAQFPIYYIADENGVIVEIKGKRGPSGHPVWRGTDNCTYLLDDHLMKAERCNEDFLMNGEFVLYKSREEIEKRLLKWDRHGTLAKSEVGEYRISYLGEGFHFFTILESVGTIASSTSKKDAQTAAQNDYSRRLSDLASASTETE